MCAILVDRHHLTKEQIGNMDRWWIQHVYMHTRDQDGRILVRHKQEAKSTAVTLRDRFFWWGRKLWLPGWYIDKLWAEEQERSKAAAKAKGDHDDREQHTGRERGERRQSASFS